MSNFSKAEENYIEHEVQLRLHDEKFKSLEKKLEHVNNKLNWIIGIILSSVLLPVGLPFLKLI